MLEFKLSEVIYQAIFDGTLKGYLHYLDDYSNIIHFSPSRK
ncbi:hypothetical protein [Candidatus Enterococcus mangumiae]